MADGNYHLERKDRRPASANPPRSRNHDLGLVGKALGTEFFTDEDMDDAGTFFTFATKDGQLAFPVLLARNGPLVKAHAIPFTSAKSPEEAESRMADLVLNYAVTIQTGTRVFAMPQHTSADELLMKLSVAEDAIWRAIAKPTSEKTA